MKILRKMSLMIGLAIVFGSISGYAADKGNFSAKPATNNGKKWRIGYYEGGPYIDYPKSLIATVNGLIELGWASPVEIPFQNITQTQELWTWLATQLKSEYIEFVADAHYSANWDPEVRKTTAAQIIERLSTKRDLDAMIAMGTWAGQDLANDKHQVPIVVESTSNAIASNIVKSLEDSGYEHVHARLDPFRYERQVKIFHDIIGFQKLGVAYLHTNEGRSYAAIDDVEKVAAAEGFEIVGCDLVEPTETNTIQCFRDLVGKVDAIYVTLQKGINKNSIPTLVEIANTNRTPTFSQSGSEEVKNGFLLSISTASYKYVGQFYAQTLAKIFNGAKPRQIDQLFEDPPKIAINLKTAEIIGYDPPVDVLGAADEIFQEIVAP